MCLSACLSELLSFTLPVTLLSLLWLYIKLDIVAFDTVVLSLLWLLVINIYYC